MIAYLLIYFWQYWGVNLGLHESQQALRYCVISKLSFPLPLGQVLMKLFSLASVVQTCLEFIIPQS